MGLSVEIPNLIWGVASTSHWPGGFAKQLLWGAQLEPFLGFWKALAFWRQDVLHDFALTKQILKELVLEEQQPLSYCGEKNPQNCSTCTAVLVQHADHFF